MGWFITILAGKNVLAEEFKGEGHSKNRIFCVIANKKVTLN